MSASRVRRPLVPRILLAGLALVGAGTRAPAQAEALEPPPAAIEREGDLVSIFSGDVEVPAGVRQSGDVVCVGGDVTIRGEVSGDVVVVLGRLELTGQVQGQVAAVVTRGRLSGARIGGDLVTVAGSLSLEQSEVDGQLVSVLGRLDRDALTRVADNALNLGFGPWMRDLWSLMTWVRVAHKLLIFVVLLLIVAVAAGRVRAMGEEAPLRYVPAFFVGLLGYLGLLVALGLLLFTLVGVPLAALAFAVIKWMGIAALFYALGRRAGRVVGREMSTLGAVLLIFALYAGLFLAPAALGFGAAQMVLLALLRFGFFLFFEVPAVGLVILTRAGAAASSQRRASPVA
jgi:hypothetical protein